MRKIKRAGSLLLAAIVSAAMLTACGNATTSSGGGSSETTTTAAAATTAATTEKPADPVELTVSAAASLTDVMGEIKDMYTTVAPNVTLTYNFGSSGTLQEQIEQGAPADIFMSAAQKQMNALDEKGLLAADTRKDLLVNKLVLIVPSDSTKELTSFEDVPSDKVEKIALGGEGVPVGQYAQEVFTFLNTWDQVSSKAVLGADVRQVLTWVESGEVDCGVVYATDAAISGDKVKVVAEAPEGSLKPVIYPVAVLKDSKNQEAAKAFVDYLSDADVAAVFEKYGFVMN